MIFFFSLKAFSKIVSSSKDPSPSLPFWDKIRLIYHGRLTMIIRQLTVLLHASLDPYNTTEEMEVTWNDVEMDWTNGQCRLLYVLLQTFSFNIAIVDVLIL